MVKSLLMVLMVLMTFYAIRKPTVTPPLSPPTPSPACPCVPEQLVAIRVSATINHDLDSSLSRFLQTISASGRTSASRLSTIWARTSFTNSFGYDRKHAPQTLTKFGDLLNYPIGRNPKIVQKVSPEQFRQTPGADRRHALFIAAQGMEPSCKPSQANPDEPAGAKDRSSSSFTMRLVHLSWKSFRLKSEAIGRPCKNSSPVSVVTVSFFRSRRTTSISGRASPCCLKKGFRSARLDPQNWTWTLCSWTSRRFRGQRRRTRRMTRSLSF